MSIKIEFEGVDGSGKTTGLKFFAEKATAMGLDIVETREVGNPHIPACVKLREFVLDPESNLGGSSMEFIFSAMRMENQRWLNKIQEENPKLNFVVSDRGWFSHLAYTDHNISEQFTEDLYGSVLSKHTTLPDVVIYFAINTETALHRRNLRNGKVDVIEAKGVEFQEKVRQSFVKHMTLAQEKNLCKFYVVDANRDLDDVKRQLEVILVKIAAEVGIY